MRRETARHPRFGRKRRKSLFFLGALAAILGAGTGAAAQQSEEPTTYTISGIIVDADSGENIIGAAIYAPYVGVGTTTNQFGFYSLALKADSVTLFITHVVYESQILRQQLEADVRLNITLQPATLGLDMVEVVASAGGQHVDDVQMSRVDLPVADIQTLPALLGEVDVLKVIQLLPGVQSGTEATSGIYVRGGGADQNLFLLDGTPIYNPSHLFGFLSVFNGDAIKDVSLIKGGFPARFGGRLSSVVDLTMKEGNLKKMEGAATVGLVSSRATLEGPIQKDRSSFLVSARRTYLDLLVYPFLPKNEKRGYFFYDVNAKANYILSEQDRVYLSMYTGLDKGYSRVHTTENSIVDQRINEDLGWRNVAVTGRWNHIFSPRLFANTLVGYTRYRLGLGSTVTEREQIDTIEAVNVYQSRFSSGITDSHARIDFEFIPGSSHYMRFGASGIRHAFQTGARTEQSYGTDIEPLDTLFTPNHMIHGAEVSLYAENEVRLGPQLKINAGLHASGFFVNGEQYASIQPRLGLWMGLGASTALKASFASMRQYIHLLTISNGISLPSDLWVPATDRVRPQQAAQVALGVARALENGRYEVTIEGYYKSMQNLIEYAEGANYFGAGLGTWQDKIERGRGWSYGLYFFCKRRRGEPRVGSGTRCQARSGSLTRSMMARPSPIPMIVGTTSPLWSITG